MLQYILVRKDKGWVGWPTPPLPPQPSHIMVSVEEEEKEV